MQWRKFWGMLPTVPRSNKELCSTEWFTLFALLFPMCFSLPAEVAEPKKVLQLDIRGAGAEATLHSAPDYAIDVWQVEQGLPDSTVTAIAQTADGYLWLGTFNGLVRFDGVRFKVFDARTPGLEGEEILRLCGDGTGGMWIDEEVGPGVRP